MADTPTDIKSLGILIWIRAPINSTLGHAYKHYTTKDDGLKKPWEARLVQPLPTAMRQRDGWQDALSMETPLHSSILVEDECASVWMRHLRYCFKKAGCTFISQMISLQDILASVVMIAYGSDNAESLKTAVSLGHISALAAI